MVSEAGISGDPAKVEAVREWPRPENIGEYRSLLGIAGYCRRYIPGFSSIASPLTHLTRKDKLLEWSESCEQAFSELKNLLTKAPVLNYPSSEGEFVLDTDASLTRLFGVLSQIQNGEEKVITYASRTLSKSELLHNV
ncbi:uncharacterized mitochondrial protein AtMg00860-like [Pecten maximus]|uniref:uncharacterized mitochondrial protein AtMg00860-like n=1 Tax=Pecten maximus TaxID=6579 RepID=UPI0014588326|nr:uncharacterized mitochondrial protein AtMg00860-like [Pecten maximus]